MDTTFNAMLFSLVSQLIFFAIIAIILYIPYKIIVSLLGGMKRATDKAMAVRIPKQRHR